MQKMLSVIAFVSLSGGASAGLVEDQVGASFVSGGYSSFAAQSFMPSFGTLAAIDVEIIGTGALEDDVTLSVFTDWDGGSDPSSLSGLLGSQTILGVPRESRPLFVFDSVIDVTPEQTYYFVVELSTLAVGGSRSNPYDRGQVIFAGGNISGADLAFTTYAIPTPSAGALLAMGGLLTTRRRR